MMLFIDGSSLLSTSYYATLPHEITAEKDPEKKKQAYKHIMHSANGLYTNGILGFMKTLHRLINEQKPSYLMIAFDRSRNTFRREIYPEYKGTRSETPEPLKQQFGTLHQLLVKAGFAVESSEQYEADDIVASATALYAGDEPIRLYSKDQDYFQLVNDRLDIRLWMHMPKEKLEGLNKKYAGIRSRFSGSVPGDSFEFTEESVEDYYGALPALVPDLKGITGDVSDNIPGVKGVSSAAAPLLKKYKGLEGIYEAIDSCPDAKAEKELNKFWKENLGIVRNPINALKAGRDSAFISRDLATMRKNCPLSCWIGDMDVCGINKDSLRAMYNSLGLNSLLSFV